MNFDLGALEKIGQQKDPESAKSSRFNPRTQPRPRPRPQQRPSQTGSQGKEASQTKTAVPSSAPSDREASASDASAPQSRSDIGSATPPGAAAQPVRQNNAAAEPLNPAPSPTATTATAVSTGGASNATAPAVAAPNQRSQNDAQPASNQLQRQARQSAPRPRQQTARATASGAATELASLDWPDSDVAAPAPLQPQAGVGTRNGVRLARTVASARRDSQAASPEAAKRAAPEEPSPMPLAKRPEGGVGRGRPRVALPDQLDVDTMSLKEVIRWSNGKEREVLNAEKRKKELAALAAAAAANDGNGAAAPAPAPSGVWSPPPRLEAPSSGTALAPQVHIVNGQIRINQTTLTVQAQPEDTQRAVVEDNQRLNSHTYAVNRLPSSRWTEEETENFYAALATFGSDFTLISNVFPNKNRLQVKNKFTKESKVNPRRIDDALRGRGCNTIAYEDVLGRIQYDANSTEMLQIEAPQPGN